MPDYRCTYTQHDTNDSLMEHTVAILAGVSSEAVKLRAGERFGLGDWNPWTCTADGAFQRTHTPTPERPYRGIITLEPIKKQ